MYALLIVDDERMIADLLCEYLQSKLDGELDFFKAYTGRNALEIMSGTHINILVTDINMPGIDGLELHKRAKGINPQLKVIFLTGYNDFTNIQYALRNESVDYILKTESNETIYNSIQKAITELDNEVNFERIQQQAARQLTLTLPLLWERLVLALLAGEPYDRQAFVGASFPLQTGENILLLMGRADEGSAVSKNDLFKMKNTADEYLKKSCRVFSVTEGNDVLWLLQPAVYSARLTRSAVQSGMDTVRQICLQFNISISLALSDSYIALPDISHAWQGLKQTLKNMYGMGRGMLLVDNSGCRRQAGGGWPHINNLLNQLSQCVENLQQDKYYDCYQRLSAAVKSNAQINPSETLEIAMRIYLSFLSNFNLSGLPFEQPFTDYSSSGGGWDSYEKLLTETAGAFFTGQQQNSFQHTNQVFGKLQKYIQANLGGDTSLNTLAELCHFSPSYLSRMFKQMTNVTLSEYIGRKKYEKAARMLKESEMKIVHIARELGFDTQSYFTRFFKKYTGISPQEYRDKETNA